MSARELTLPWREDPNESVDERTMRLLATRADMRAVVGFNWFEHHYRWPRKGPNPHEAWAALTDEERAAWEQRAVDAIAQWQEEGRQRLRLVRGDA